MNLASTTVFTSSIINNCPAITLRLKELILGAEQPTYDTSIFTISGSTLNL
jgi:hypothetical protein